MDSKLVDAWFWRGNVWAATQDFARALADYDQALKLSPRLADASSNRGATRLLLCLRAEAEALRQMP
jgi:tetratricopeptide (TPR) repeat protein